MKPSSIDLRSISCQGIKSFNLFAKPSLFALISVTSPSSTPKRPLQSHKTSVDSDAGENPEWPGSFRFDIDLERHGLDLALDIQVMAQGNLLHLLPERPVGRVHVPIADLWKEGSDGSVRHVSYRVVGADAKPNGVITFSYNVNYPPPAAPEPDSFSNYPPPPLQAYPAGDFYPPPRQQEWPQLYPAVPSPAGNYYYPPPLQQEPVIVPPAGPDYNYYPPPAQHYPVVSAPACDYYPAATVDRGCYPPPPSVNLAYPPTCCYPPPDQQPPPASCCSRPESWERRLY